jgi:hypothetical protein
VPPPPPRAPGWGAHDSASDTPATTADDTAPTSVAETAPTSEETEETAEESPVDVDSGETGDEPAADDTATGTDDSGDVDTGDDTGDDGSVIRTIDDVPAACQDEMAKFLRALEPIVSPIDWQEATMAEFEQIANDFQEEADEFQAASSSAGCDNFVFDEENEGDILVEFARAEAPGAVGFLEFLELMRTSATPGDDDGAAASAGIDTCEDAIEFLQALMDDYGTMSEVPASELLKIPTIAGLYAECTPEQLEFFDNPDLELFMGG